MKDKRPFRLHLGTRFYHLSRRLFVSTTVQNLVLHVLYPLSFLRKLSMSKNVHIYAHPLSTAGYRVFSEGQPGNSEFRHFTEVLHQDDRLLEVGSHFGIFTITAAKMLDPTRVIGIDCSPVAHQLSKLNARANGTSSAIFHFAAFSDEARETRVTLGNFYMAGLDPKGDFTVQVVTGDIWCQRRQFTPSVIKIDVEGHEEKVLRGLSGTLRQVRMVLLEVHDFLLSPKEIAKVFQCLNEAGLTIHNDLSLKFKSQPGTSLFRVTRPVSSTLPPSS